MSCGQAIWALATSLGLAAVLVASEPVYLALTALGAAYLVWLGARCLWRALRGRAHDAAGRTAAPHASRPAPPSARGSSPISATPRWPCSSRACSPSSRLRTRRSRPRSRSGSSSACSRSAGSRSTRASIARASHVFGRPLARRVLDALTGTVLVALGRAPAQRSGAARELEARRRCGDRRQGCYHPARALRDRLMVGRRILVPEVGVRVPVPQLVDIGPRVGAVRKRALVCCSRRTTIVTVNSRIL